MGSPDVIGFNTGAWSGVLLTVVLWHGNEWMLAAGALLGGSLTAALIFALAWQGGLSRLRLIIIGIANIDNFIKYAMYTAIKPP